MMVIQMEPRTDKKVPAQRYCYTIPQLIEIGRKTSFPVSIGRFSIEAIQGQSCLHALLDHILELHSAVSSLD